MPATDRCEEGPWSERVPQAVGLFVIGVAIAIAAQRHEFTHPDLALLPICLITVPWVLDMANWPRFLMVERRFDLWLLTATSLMRLGCVYWLSVDFRVNDDFAPFFLTVLIGEMASVAGPGFGAAVWAACVGGLIVLTYVNHFSGLLIWGFAFTIGWMGGTAFRHQTMIAFELTQTQSELAARAAENERHRLARDIHDLVAHSLAVTMLQLSGARMALRAGDTDEALEALHDAETAGRAAMAEIHRTMGLLGANEHEGSLPPTPSASDVPDLVRSFRQAGLQIHFALAGDLDAVPLSAGLAAYRVVQESLANSVKHAPGASVDLAVTIGSGTVDITVVNDIVAGIAPSPSGGNGLRGMAERAQLLGGSAVAGNGDGTWKVRASIPWALTPA
jgi:signal transduction histidine kinase